MPDPAIPSIVQAAKHSTTEEPEMTEEQRAEMAGGIAANRTLIIMLMRLLVVRGLVSQDDLRDALIEATHAVAARDDPAALAEAQTQIRLWAELFDPGASRPGGD